jgi:hypothetical protein
VEFLALERPVPGVHDAAFTPTMLEQEARQAWALHQSGVVRWLRFRADRHEAVLLLECPSATAARDALATLPLVRARLIDFEIVELRAYDGFARLFRGSTSG